MCVTAKFFCLENLNEGLHFCELYKTSKFIVRRRRTLVSHTSFSSTSDDAYLHQALPNHNRENKYQGLGLWGPSSHFYASPTCSPPELQTSPAECQAAGRHVVSFDAPQPKYAGLFFKTLSIRLNEACVSCLYLACGDVLYRSVTFLTVWSTHRHTCRHTRLHLTSKFWSLSLCLNNFITGNEM